MAGTIPLSMTQQFDEYANPLAGGQLYIIQAGTVSTPQDAFQDIDLTIRQPYPMTLDAAGRVPQFFLADGTVKVRLQDARGVVQLAADSVMVIGPSSGGGGGGGVVDPTQLISTGMMMFRHSASAVAGFVRLNGLTIGSSTSGATERANADCQTLFLLLWPDINLAISGGVRGASASSDWTSNRQLALPDWRGTALAGVDGMGNVASGRLSSAVFGSVPTVVGNSGGAESVALALDQIPSHDHFVYLHDPSHRHTYALPQFGGGSGPGLSVGTGAAPNSNTSFESTGVTVGSVSGIANDNRTALAGGGQLHTNTQPTRLVTFFIKL